ncbi:hemin uptake protein HemP [Pseudooceanicola sp. LIPI14-2-Ac024]|uniref:hemin uptake protein HemP n=1 Tax=Pseudooceanicola sp. LIPI14-2-Ac024 TaxID=3344875 RepID=UPI0035D0C94B
MTTQPLSITPASRVIAMPTHDAEMLTGPDGLAKIVLNDQVYQLRITRAGKLILTK